jgi:predicted enzyme related to lactoylglutathione lyase
MKLMLRLLVNIDVNDIERAVAFYTEAFALTAGRRFRNDAVELLGAAVPIYLLAKAGDSTAAPGASAARTYGRHWTPVHLDFVVDEIAVALSRAEGAGAVRESEISTHPWGRLALLADPFGHGCCLVEFSERGYDAITTG